MQSFFIGGLSLLILVLWIWAMFDVVKSRKQNRNVQPLWLLLIFIFPILGPIIYFQMAKNSRIGGRRRFIPNFRKHH